MERAMIVPERKVETDELTSEESKDTSKGLWLALQVTCLGKACVWLVCHLFVLPWCFLSATSLNVARGGASSA